MSNVYDEIKTADLPDVSNVFDSPAQKETVATAGDKVAGQADSVRNQKTTVKAPGGNDAARQKDGG